MSTERKIEQEGARHDLCFWLGLMSIIILFLPLFVKNPPLEDWTNHVWMINYGARYLHAHGAFQSVFNTYELVGMPFPIFYGYLFFKFMALVSVLVDANITLRACALLVAVCQFCVLYRTVLSEGGNRGLALAIGTLFGWAVYPLTNLYVRSALPEYVACGFLTIACLGIFRASKASSQLQFWTWCNAAGLCMTAAAGTHPITGVYGICSFAGLVLVFMLVRPNKPRYKLIVGLIPPAMIGIICIMPWLICTSEFKKDLVITQYFGSVMYVPLFDKFSDRLMPIPTRFCKLPIRILEHKRVTLPQDESPVGNIDAPINIPLAVLFVMLSLRVCRDAKPALIFAIIGTFVVALALISFSCVRGSLDHLGVIATSIQWAYRLVTYVNLAILFGVLFCLSSTSAVLEWHSTNKPVLWLLLSIAAVAVVLRVMIMWKSPAIDPVVFSYQRTDAQLLHLPVTFTGNQDYATPSRFAMHHAFGPAFDQTIHFKPADSNSFGDVPAVDAGKIDHAHNWLRTNVLAFAWNHLRADDRELSSVSGPVACGSPKEQLVDSRIKPFYLCTVSDGMLAYSFVPSGLWMLLNAIAVPTFFVWTAASGVLTLWVWRQPADQAT